VGVTEVTFYVDSTPYTGTFNTGTWSSAPITGFTSGAYVITAQAKDAAGNTTTSSSFSLTIDTTAPSAPSAPDLAAVSDSGVNTDNTTNINPVTFTGTAEAGSTVSLYAQTGCGGSAVATTTGGSYTFTGVALTANAITTFSAKATDAAGNASPCSSNLAVTHDTTAPTVAFAATAGNYISSQTLSLTATYSEPVTISAGGNPSVPLTLTTGTLTATDTGGATTNVTTRTFTTGTIGASGTHQDTDRTLNVGTVALNSATITDAAGNALTLTPNPATVTGVTINDCPNIGNSCSDGSIYAGVSPDGNKAMYVTTAANEHSGIAWNDGTGNWRDTDLGNCSSGSETTCRTGQSNSNTLATEDSSSAAGTQPHYAAQYCENLTAHSQTDWYLPAKDEMNVLYTNRTAIGGFVSAWYWSSSEIISSGAWMYSFYTGNQFNFNKNNTFRVRCVRRVN
jgi:hypothetical protein